MLHVVGHAVSARCGADACIAATSGVYVVFVLFMFEASGADAAILATTFDALVAVLVKAAKVFPHDLLPRADLVAIVKIEEGFLESSDSFLVEFVLMTLQVAELGKLLVAVIKAASKWLGCRVNDPVCSHIAALSKSLAAKLTAVRTLSGVTAFVSLEVSKL
jgi:hypothetical protein